MSDARQPTLQLFQELKSISKYKLHNYGIPEIPAVFPHPVLMSQRSKTSIIPASLWVSVIFSTTLLDTYLPLAVTLCHRVHLYRLLEVGGVIVGGVIAVIVIAAAYSSSFTPTSSSSSFSSYFPGQGRSYPNCGW